MNMEAVISKHAEKKISRSNKKKHVPREIKKELRRKKKASQLLRKKLNFSQEEIRKIRAKI